MRISIRPYQAGSSPVFSRIACGRIENTPNSLMPMMTPAMTHGSLLRQPLPSWLAGRATTGSQVKVAPMAIGRHNRTKPAAPRKNRVGVSSGDSRISPASRLPMFMATRL
ncbi:hypothetical protein D3C76_990480 [compost metagenome]